MKIDELIQAAEQEANQASEEQKAVAQAKLDALKSVKSSGVEMDNDEVNGVIKREREKAEKGAHDSWREVLDMDLEEAKETLEGMNDEELQTLLGGEGSGDGESEETMADRIKAALEERDKRINSLAESQHDFQRRAFDSEISGKLTDALRAEGLQDAYLDPAKRLSGYDKLVDKAMEGEIPSQEEIQQTAGSIKELSPVWFQSSEPSDGSREVAGVRVKDGIPATPRENRSSELTEQQRAERAASVY